MCEPDSRSSRKTRSPASGVVVRAMLLVLGLATLDFAALADAAPLNLKVALANLGRPAPAVKTLRSVGAIAAGAVATALPDHIFAQGFDNANSQCVMIADCPGTGFECTGDVCSDGLCAEVPSPSGTSCSVGVCDGSGSCVQCVVDANCPVTGLCVSSACSSNICIPLQLPAGTPCSGGFCDSFGSCVQCLAAADCPDTGSECVARTCTAGVCGQTSEPVGTACSQGFCDFSGTCVQCLSASDCPATGNECVLATCTAGTCGQQNAPSGTICSIGICDGSGICISP